MSRIPTITEQQLSNLNPSRLNRVFLARLTASADGTLTALSEEEAAFEYQMHSIRPKAIPANLYASLLETLGDTPFAVDEKIVLFNKPSTATLGAGKSRNTFRFNLAAAAAVALLGSIAAFMVPANTSKDHSAHIPALPEPVITPVAPTPSLVAPAGFQRDVNDTRDEGVVWRGKNEPHRVFRRSFTERLTVKDEDGNPINMERPGVEYVIIPEKID